MAARASSRPISAPHHGGVASAPAPADCNVPDVVEDRREGDGGVAVRRYVRGRLLGKGGFAKCYKFTAIDKGNKIVAGKVVDKSTLAKSKAKSKLLAEIRIHRSLGHRYVVAFDTVFEDRANVYIMLEICPNQTMMELVRARTRLTEVEARYYCLQLLDAMRYLHANNIIHRDLKLGNLLLSADMEIRVGDFGLATQLENDAERKRTICGTPNYIAPEILDNRFGHSFEVDVWAFGVILFTVLFGKPPFETTDVKTTYKRIRDNVYTFPEHVAASSAAKDLIARILQTDPAARPSLEQIARHPFMSGPDATVPRCMPITALQTAPVFMPSDLVPASAAVESMLASEIGGLSIRTSSSARAASVAAGVASTTDVRPRAGTLETVPDATEETEGTASMDLVDDRASPYPGAPSAGSSLSHKYSTASRSSTATEKENAAPAGIAGVKGARGSSLEPHGHAGPRRVPAVAPTNLPTMSVLAGHNANTGRAPAAAPLLARATSAPSMTHTQASEPAAAAAPVDSWSRKPPAPLATTARRVAVAVGGENAAAKVTAVAVEPPTSQRVPNRRAFDVLSSSAATDAPSAGLHRHASAPPDAFGPSATSHASRPGVIVPFEDEDVRSNSHAGGDSARAGGQSPMSLDAAPLPPTTHRPTLAISAPSSTSSEAGMWFSNGITPALNAATPAVHDPARAPATHAPAARTSLPASAGYTSMSVAAYHARLTAATSPATSPRPTVTADSGTQHAAALAHRMRAPPLLPRSSSNTAADDDVVMHTEGAPARASPPPPPPPPAARVTLNDTLQAIHGQLSTPNKAAHTSLCDALAAVRIHHDDVDMSSGMGSPTLPRANLQPSVWVSVWVDYTSKYGLGYMLSNGCIGVYFNDSTKIILASDGLHFQYVERQSHGRSSAPPAWSVAAADAAVFRGHDDLHRVCATLSRHPPELKKKVTLLRHFTTYLHDQYAKRVELTRTGRTAVIPVLESDGGDGNTAQLPGAKPGSSAYATNGTAACCGMVLQLADGEEACMAAGSGSGAATEANALPFVKKWVRTKRCVLFRLSNRCVQVCFLDGTSLLLWREGQAATFTDRSGTRTHLSPSAVLRAHVHNASSSMGTGAEPHVERATMDTAVRLRYVRDVVAQLMAPHAAAAGGAARHGALPGSSGDAITAGDV